MDCKYFAPKTWFPMAETFERGSAVVPLTRMGRLLSRGAVPTMRMWPSASSVQANSTPNNLPSVKCLRYRPPGEREECQGSAHRLCFHGRRPSRSHGDGEPGLRTQRRDTVSAADRVASTFMIAVLVVHSNVRRIYDVFGDEPRLQFIGSNYTTDQ